jgi:beta-lactamase class A
MIQGLQQQIEHLNHLNCLYAFYFKQSGQSPVLQMNCTRFPSASIIKLPILLAWAYLERSGDVGRDEICDLDADRQVEGSGFSWLLRARRIPFQDVLLMMMALSDNLCTNLVIDRIGFERLNKIFYSELGLEGAELHRKMMDFDARRLGTENWVTAQDCIMMFDLIHLLTAEERAWIEPMLLANQDTSLFMRDLGPNSVLFYHKTGSLKGIFHDWGYTSNKNLFLLTQNVQDEIAVRRIFGELGKLLEN